MSAAAASQRAYERFAAELGEEHCVSGPDELREFRDPFALRRLGGHTPAAAVLPSTVEEVQAIVAIAASTACRCGRTPPAATTATAAPAPLVRGSVVVSLRQHEPRARARRRARLRGRRAGRALVRPLRGDRGGRARPDALDRGPRLGRPVGNLLENGVTYLPYGIDWVAQCGMEVVLPERRAAAHRHGGDARQPRLEPLQARSRPDARPALHAVELRDRHQARASG